MHHRRNSRAISPRTTAMTRHNAVNAFCNAVNAFCSGARPFCSRATPNAMVRGEIARERHFSAALRAIKSAGRRLFQ